MKIVKLSEIKIHRWSGGTTRELLIYPEGSSFNNGNFEMRISIATVEQDATTFTPLKDTYRTLLVLEGTQALDHQGAHSSKLKALEQDSFSGNWTTYCRGKSTNFNVMTKSSKRAEINVKNYNKNEIWSNENSNGIHFLYILRGSARLIEQEVLAKEGILIDEPCQITFLEPSELVIVTYP
ncbi:MAG: HutD family protein [Fluviicola sp.]